MKSSIPIYAIENLKSYQNEGILVSEFGYYLSQHQHLMTPHKHTFYHLVFFTAGTGQQQIDFERFDIRPGLIYFMTPGQVHNWNFATEPNGYIINFSTNYFSSFLLETDYLSRFRFFSGDLAGQVINLPVTVQQKVVSIFEDILSEGLNEGEQHDDLVKIALLSLFITVSRYQSTQDTFVESTYNHTLLSNFNALIEQNFKTLKLPKQYAALLYITPNHLNAVCNDFLGISAGTLIRNRIVLEAKRLLINLDLRVSEISDQLNFTDQSYFIKFFKKQEGLTPEKFRKTLSHGN